MSNTYYVYIATNDDNYVLYIGVTNNVIERMSQHRSKTGSKFTKQYNISKLVFLKNTKISTMQLREKKD